MCLCILILILIILAIVYPLPDEGLCCLFPLKMFLSFLLPTGPTTLADVVDPLGFRPLLGHPFYVCVCVSRPELPYGKMGGQ